MPSAIRKKWSGNFSVVIQWLISWAIYLTTIHFLEVLLLKKSLENSGFKCDPYFFLYAGSQRNRGVNRGQRSQNQNSLSTSFFSPVGFGLGGPMISSFFSSHDMGHGGNQFFSTTTFGVGGGSASAAPAVKRTSTSTRISNGKKIITKKYYGFLQIVTF